VIDGAPNYLNWIGASVAPESEPEPAPARPRPAGRKRK